MINKWKKLGLLALSLIMILPTITAYAIENNGTGGGSNTSPSTRGYIGRYWAFQENNGIRLYLANKQGLVVSNMVDMVNYIPESIDSFGNTELSQWYKEYEGYTGKNPVKKEILYMGGAKSDPVYGLSYTKNSYTGKESSDPGVYFYPNIDGKRDTYYKQKMYTYTVLENYLNNYANTNFPENTNHISSIDGTYPYTDPITKKVIQIPHKIQGPVQRGGKGTVGTGDVFMKQMMTPLGEKDGEIVYTAQALLYLELPQVTPNGMKIIGGNEPLFEFYDTTLKKQQADLMATGMGYSNAMYKVAKDNGLYVGAEPIGWFVNEVVKPNAEAGKNGTDLNSYWCAPTVVYGTVTQASWFTGYQLMEDLKNSGMSENKAYDTLKSCGQTWQWSLAYTAFRLQKPDPALGMKTFEERGIDPELVGSNNNPYDLSLQYWYNHTHNLGYGIMLFGLKPEVYVNTPTWDSIQFPEDHYKPGVTPSMEHIKTEGSDYQQAVYPDGTKKDHNFSITKFYCRENPDGTYTYKCNYTRTNTIHTITLNDEPGYKVGSYFTSPELKLPNAADTSYDDYKATLPKGDFTGDSTGNITVPASSNDRALYMKLISTKPVDEPDTVPIPLWEYEISKQIPERAITDKSHRIVTNTLPAIPNDVYESDYKVQYKPGDKYGWIKWYNYTNPGIENAPADLLAVPAPFEKSYTGLNSGKKVASRGHTKEVTNTMDSIFCIWRGMDMPTLASYKMIHGSFFVVGKLSLKD